MTEEEDDLFESFCQATGAQHNSSSDLFKSSGSQNTGLLLKLSNFWRSPPVASRTRSKVVPSRGKQIFREFSSSKLPNFSTYERHQLITSSGVTESSCGLGPSIVDTCGYSIPEEEEKEGRKPCFSTPGPALGVGCNPNVVLNMAQFTPIPYADSPLEVNKLTKTPSFGPMRDVTNRVNLWSPAYITKSQISATSTSLSSCHIPSPSTEAGHPCINRSQLFGVPLGKKSDAHLKRLTRRFHDSFFTEHNESYLKVFQENDAETIMLKLADQKRFIRFSRLFPKNRNQSLVKIGEGTFSEVFSFTDGDVAIKLIPVEGNIRFNGEMQKKFAEVLSEVIISKEVTNLSCGSCNRTENFVQLKKLSLLVGKLPQALIKAWELFKDEQGSENDHPSIFNSRQRWIALECALCGPPLETAMPSCSVARLSIFCQTAFALAVAEYRLSFEHRDLHWGNVLLDNHYSTCTATTDCACTSQFNPPESLVDSRIYRPPPGPSVSIVDFTLSRLEHANQPLFLDLSLDKELFTGTGDIQFDIYRQMKEEVEDNWSLFRPRTNLFWLQYLIRKLSTYNARSTLVAAVCPRDTAHREAKQHLTSLANLFQTTISLSSLSSVGHFIATYPLFRSLEVVPDSDVAHLSTDLDSLSVN